MRKAIEDVNSGVLLGASARVGNVLDDTSSDELLQSTTEKDSETGIYDTKTCKYKHNIVLLHLTESHHSENEKPDPETPTLTPRHVKFLRQLSLSRGTGTVETNISKSNVNAPVENSLLDNQP